MSLLVHYVNFLHSTIKIIPATPKFRLCYMYKGPRCKSKTLDWIQCVVLVLHVQLYCATPEHTPVYIYLYPWNEVYMTYVSPWVPLI